MKKAFLHIGMHKTGTTAIQSAFDGLDDGLTRYADLGFENHSIPFYTAFSGHHQTYHIWLSAGLTPEEIEKRRAESRRKIERTLAKTSNRNLIFSGEDISVLSRAALLDVRDMLAAHDWNVQVLIYVRDPASFIISNFQEGIKTGTNLKTPVAPQYRFRIEKFLEIFGKENVVIRNFDPATLLNGDIVEDFASQIGVQAPHKGENQNTSLSTEAVRISYLSAKLVPNFNKNNDLSRARRRLIDHARHVFPGRLEFPLDLVSGVIDRNDLEWLFSVSGIDFRRSISKTTPFSASAVQAFLASPEKSTVGSLSAFLAKVMDVWDDPDDLLCLIARYFMFFLDAERPSDIRFDPKIYLELNPDVRIAGVDPYVHYLRFGIFKNRRVR